MTSISTTLPDQTFGNSGVQARITRWWFPACSLALVVASDYKFRTRDPRDSLSATVDQAILIELGLYALVAGYLLFVHPRLVAARRMRSRRPRPQTYFACLFVGLMALSLLYTPYPTYAAVRVAQMVIVLALILTASASATRADFHRFLHSYLVLIAVSVVYGILVPAPPLTPLQAGRFTWLSIHPTTSGVLTGLAAVIVVSYVAQGRNRRLRPGPDWPPMVYVLLLVVVGYALIATKTRGAIAAAAVAAIVVILSLHRGRGFLRAAGAIAAFIVIGALAIGPFATQYLERGATREQLGTLSNRTDLWDIAIDAVKESPTYGFGVTSAQGIFYEQTGLGGGHNAVIQVVVEQGVVGLLVWLSLVGFLFVGTRRLPRNGASDLEFDRAVLLGLLVFLMVNGLVFQGAAETTNVASTFLFIAVAWLNVAEREPTPRPTSPAEQQEA